ncbi:uncharacterized protein ARMOST_10363 [Armillaria ostoyae]|uniref:Uncharacterized protein n=1 Tax=Armillaria ostoyae TaxID=47428 RepID=A0A284RE25_ARMOS|nr:uncharacterized protein ARMOST_10363 [Armillaria ostoyae]
MARKSTPNSSDVPRKKSGPKPWADPEQWEYLEGGIPGYRVAQATKGKKAAINNFVEELLPLWWDKFPLKGDRTVALDRKHIKEWYQNHGSVKKAAASVRIRDIFPKQRSRALKAEELYSQKYYESRVKPVVDEKKKDAMSQGEILNMVKTTMKEMFAAEAEDIREEILTEVKEQPSLVPEKDGVMTPEMYAAGIKAAPKQIEVFIKALAEATGSGVLLIFGGPDPWDEKGKVCSYGFHAAPDVRAARVLGGNASIAEKQNGGVEGMGDIAVDDEARPPAEQEQAVGEKELSQTENGQVDEVQTNEARAIAESNDSGDRQKEPEMEVNPEDNNPMPRSPKAPTPVPSSPANPEDNNPVPRSPRALTPVPSSPRGSPTNSRGLSQTPASPRMNEVDSNEAEKNLQDDIISANNPSDQVITQVDGAIAPESNTVKRPRPRSRAKLTPVEDGLVTTRGKRIGSFAIFHGLPNFLACLMLPRL